MFTKTKTVLALSLAGAFSVGLALPSNAITMTVGAHADTAGAAFVFSGSVLHGGYTQPGLNLIVFGTTYSNVGFELSGPLAAHHGISLGGIDQFSLPAGHVRYFQLSDPTVDLFKVSFAGATLTMPGGFGGAHADLQGVSFSGTAVSGWSFTDQSFSYSFVPAGGDAFKANFTSSAVVQPVPEPFTMGLAAAALGAAVARRRRSR